MATQLRSSRCEAMGRGPSLGHGATSGAGGWERLVHAALAIYLAPALVIALAVGGLGLLVLAVVRVVGWAVSGCRASLADGPTIPDVEKCGRP